MSIPFQAVLRDNEADRFKWSVKKMKRRSLISLCVCAIAAGGLLVGCSDDAAKSGVLKVGASPVPHADILKAAQPMLAKEGVKLEVIEFTDYVQPNMALADKELDANFFQHKPYLDNFAKERKLQLESLVAVHIEPMGVYSKKVKDVKAVADGAKVAIPNDPTNGGRALKILADAGFFTLKEGVGVNGTPADIVANPKQIQIIEMEAAVLPRALDDVDFAVINSNYALGVNLNPMKDALYMESKDSPYANIVAVRTRDKREDLQKLAKALTSPEMRKFIEDKYQGAVVPAF